jgi:hypothetical protein
MSSYTPPQSIIDQVFAYIQAHPWVAVPTLVRWWISKDNGNKPRQAHASIRILIDGGTVIQRTSDSVRSSTGQFANELHEA